MAPSPRLQKLNALLHREPYASIAYSIFWTWILVAVVPAVAIIVLPILGIYRIMAWYKDWWGVNYFDPSSHSDNSTELAIVITGCDSGFGKELALWAAEDGFFVFAGCLSKDSFEQFKVKSAGSRIIPMIMDVTNDADVKKAADQVSKWLNDESSSKTNKKTKQKTKKRFFHALINNAGITKVGMFDWIEIDDYRRVMEVNFFGVLRTCKAFLPLLKKQSIDGSHKRGSRIINLTSIAGLLTSTPMRARSTYATSKHASQSLTECLREELAGFDIQVASVNPTYHNSGFAANMLSGLENTYNKDISPSLRQEYGTGKSTLIREVSIYTIF
jgi:NAD(P)-dependent dehydrogenase (short-subunit alcohol dehydrogenase family)